MARIYLIENDSDKEMVKLCSQNGNMVSELALLHSDILSDLDIKYEDLENQCEIELVVNNKSECDRPLTESMHEVVYGGPSASVSDMGAPEGVWQTIKS